MKEHRYDLLPIYGHGTVIGYFSADVWNEHDTISPHHITPQDIIPYQTCVRDVIQERVAQERRFFFLAGETRIIGLVSAVNLNARQVKIWLFSLLCELEVLLGRYLYRCVGEDAMKALEFDKGYATGEAESNRVSRIRQQYEDDRRNGVEVSFTEYLYLTDLVKITSKSGAYSKINYPKKGDVDRMVRPLISLRDSVAHPTRSLVPSLRADEVDKLWRQIERIEDTLSRLRAVQHPFF